MEAQERYVTFQLYKLNNFKNIESNLFERNNLDK